MFHLPLQFNFLDPVAPFLGTHRNMIGWLRGANFDQRKTLSKGFAACRWRVPWVQTGNQKVRDDLLQPAPLMDSAELDRADQIIR